MKNFLLFALLLIALLAGCGEQPSPTRYVNQEPSWIMNPNQDGKNGAIGVAGVTYDQRVSSQRKLAITRALDELTLQKGVKVELTISKEESLAHGESTSTLNEKSDYNAAATITAHIEKVWQNKLTNEIYVWMVLD
jgi:uncharacterized lipoprotein YajG